MILSFLEVYFKAHFYYFLGDPSHRCYKLSPAPIIDVFRPHFTAHPPPQQSSGVIPVSPAPTSFLPPESPYSDEPVHLCTANFCGENARCRFRNNHPECHCLSGYKGDPYKGCQRAAISPSALRQACSVCGPNSVCSMVSSDVRCLCAPDTVDTPPNCRRVSSPSASSPSSSSFTSVSSFPSSHLQNPQVSIVTSSAQLVAHLQKNRDQHLSSIISSSFSLSNRPHHHHHSHHKNSHFACTSDKDCPRDKVCFTAKRKCLNPCLWACSDSAVCSVTNHHVHCRCPVGHKGNPHIQCSKVPAVPQPEPESDQQQAVPENHPCRLTCGPHTVCRRISAHEMNRLRMSAFSNQSLPRDPFQRALVHYIQRVTDNNQKYTNTPKRGQPVDKSDDGDGHFTECMCMEGAVGNPYSIEGCTFNSNSNYPVDSRFNSSHSRPFSDDLLQSSSNSNTIVIPADPCNKNSNICGPHSLCVSFKGQAFCRCDYDSVGEPPNCMLRCGKEQHCLFNQVCVQDRCVPQYQGRSDNEQSTNNNKI